MTRKGVVSTVDNTNKTARVIIPELNNTVSSELSIAYYVGELKINDIVIIDFFEDNMSEGLIIANLSNNKGQESSNSGSTYIYNQISASSEWTIQHNLGKFPNVTIVDSAGSVVIGDITYISENEIRVSFQGAFAGKAYLN